MRSLLLAASVFAATASVAIAEGGHAPQPMPPVTVAPQIMDCSGAYGGLSAGQ